MAALLASRWQALVVGGVLVALMALLGLAQLTRAQANQSREVQRVVKTYEIALMGGDGDRACAQLTSDAQRELIRSASAAGLGGDCRQVALATKGYVDRLIAQAPSPAKAAEARSLIADPPVEIVEIDSDSATARLTETMSDPIHLVRGDDGWRISALSFPARG
jgi:Putative lumazine-binding